MLKHNVMLNKSSAALFLSITSWLSCLLIVAHHLVYKAQYAESQLSLLSWVNIFTILCTYFMLGLFLYNSNENARKNTALILAIVSGLWLGIDLYNLFEDKDWLNRLTSLSAWIDLFRYRLFLLVTPLALLLTGIAFYGTNNDRRKKALVWLLIGGLVFLFADLANLFMDFYMQTMENRAVSSIGSELYTSIRLILNILSVPFSAAIIAFAISSYNKLDKKTTEDKEVEREDTLDKWEKTKTVTAI